MKENLEMFNNKILSTWVISSRALFVSKRSKEEKQSRKLPINVMFLTYVRVFTGIISNNITTVCMIMKSYHIKKKAVYVILEVPSTS